MIKQSGLVLFALTSGYSLTGTNSFSCRWTMAPTGSGSSRGGLSTRPFTVSLYMSLRTLLISEKHKSYPGQSLSKHLSAFVSDTRASKWEQSIYLDLTRLCGSKLRHFLEVKAVFVFFFFFLPRTPCSCWLIQQAIQQLLASTDELLRSTQAQIHAFRSDSAVR